MRAHDAGEKFRELLARPQGVFAYGIYDAMSALVAAKAGVEVIYVGGYSAAASRALPDIGILTATEMFQHIKFIAEAKGLHTPLVVDIDDGYGDIHNAQRIVKEILQLPNVAAIHMEDQQYPKRCGHIAGKALVSMDKFLGKLRAIGRVRDEINPECCIIARTDAFSASGRKKDPLMGGDVEESVQRLAAYLTEDADIGWCEFPSASRKSAEVISQGVRKNLPDAILALNISPSFSHKDWQETKLSRQELSALGYRFRFSTYPAILRAMQAVYKDALYFEYGEDEINGIKKLKADLDGSPVESVKEMVGLPEYLKLERDFDPQGEEKQKTSEGFGSLSSPH